MGKVVVHPRIHERHPEIDEQDVLNAMNAMIAYSRRKNGDWVGVGFDRRGRFIELVYALNGERFLIYHAMIPPSKKTLEELGLSR